jgi:transcriptional regulator with GAF, ATPase, and Fis domain
VLTLIFVDPPPAGVEPTPRTFDAHSVSIGRKEECDLVLPVGHISSRHAQIRRVGEQYIFSDLGSTNGSMVLRGEEQLHLGPKGRPEVALQEGDLLVLGDIDASIRLRVGLAPPAAATDVGGADNTIVASRRRRDTMGISQGISGSSPGALPVLYRLMASLAGPGQRERILGKVAEAALDAIPGAVDALVVVREEGGALKVRAEAHRGQGLCSVPDAKICARVLGGDAALLFGQHDAASVPAQTLVDRGVGSGIAAPLWGEQEALGVLQINCAAGRPDLREAHLDLAVVLAHHAAMAQERADLLAALRAAEKRLRAENALLRRRTQPEVEVVAASPAMASVLDELRRAAESDVTVLLSGETGTGKEVAARFLHEQSRRAGGLLVPVNCGALTESLLDSELFGHRKGAFTGAVESRKGVFEVASGGTVFLDEIGETPLSLQVRLLRVLEERKIKLVGDVVERPVDVRVVAATNRDLAQLVEQGRFRQDLYYRLRVFPVTLPPLRERPEDIEALCQLFARRFSQQLGKPLVGLDPALVSCLQAHRWPGNVRELANEIERAVVRVDPGEPLGLELISEELQGGLGGAAAGGAARAAPGAPQGLREQLAEVERGVISAALARHGGHKASAAKELGLTRQGLSKKIERLGL